MHNFTLVGNSMLKNNFTGLIQQKFQKDDFDAYGLELSRIHELPWHCSGSTRIILEITLMFDGGRLRARDWTTFFVDGVFPRLGAPYIKTSGFTHSVNLAEGIMHRYFHNLLDHS
jgi:hypothetical protein